MGCKGPMTFNNCSIIRYNDGTNWPIGVGRGCIGCSEPDFGDKYAYARPMANAGSKAPGGGVEKILKIEKISIAMKRYCNDSFETLGKIYPLAIPPDNPPIPRITPSN